MARRMASGIAERVDQDGDGLLRIEVGQLVDDDYVFTCESKFYEPIEPDLIALTDPDKDGFLTASELAKAITIKQSDMLADFAAILHADADKDGDGLLSPDEFSELAEAPDE